ncbi:hypothetical protein QQP08_006065 [Theobroma cacao]|nr:hypothetical protein QQP08_006065 [Theobroma cacao]
MIASMQSSDPERAFFSVQNELQISYHQSITKNLPTIIRVRGGWGVMYVGQWKTKLKSKDGMMAESQKRQWVFGLSVL